MQARSALHVFVWVSRTIFVVTASELQRALQALVSELSKEYQFAIQFSWKSESDDFSVAAGQLDGGREVTVSDTFAFGSGTKPYTAALIMGLVGKGKLRLDDPIAPLIDSFLNKGNSTTLVDLFGKEASAITVGHLLRMQSGLNDFDVPSFDEALLSKGFSLHSPFEFLRGAAIQKPTFLCIPGTCTSYSSTNYVLAGFVALAVSSGEETTWTDLDQQAVFSHNPAQFANCTFPTTGHLSSNLSVFGISGSKKGTKILEQDASIMGWTCGNLIAPASSAALFFYDLLIAGQILPLDVVKAMQDFRPLNVGWAKGQIQYGTGLMIQQASWNATYPPILGSWGSYIGHGGDTYGFLSETGVLTQFNASFSAIANEDYEGTFVKNVLVCKAIEIAAKVLLGEAIYLKCGRYPVAVLFV